ncbi:MAG: glycosyltransferase family 4 protein [Pseudomonadota bacterium]
MSERLRVLFILPSLKRAGAENQVVQLVNGLSAERFDKHLLVFEPTMDLRDQLDDATVRFWHIPRQARFDRRLARRIAEIVDEHRIDVLHCTLQIAVLLGWQARRFASASPRLVAALHTTVNRGLKEELYDRFVYRWTLAAADSIVFVCKAQQAYWVDRYPFVDNAATVIYNGISPDAFNPTHYAEAGARLREELEIGVDAVVISCIAGFRIEKNHRGLIDAFERLPSSACLVLAGRGEQEEDVRRYVTDKGLGQRVRFVGELSDVRPLLAASNVSVLASFAVETFSMAMLESMSMEVPVVVTDIGGLAEAVEDGVTGLVVPVRNTGALSQALLSCVEDPPRLRAMGTAARERVVHSFSQQAMVAETGGLLEALHAAPEQVR